MWPPLTRGLAKKYEVDLFSDGSDELEEMLKVLWIAIYAVLMLPVLEKQSVYRFENGDEATGDAFFHQAGAALSLRYAKSAPRCPARTADRTLHPRY